MQKILINIFLYLDKIFLYYLSFSNLNNICSNLCSKIIWFLLNSIFQKFFIRICLHRIFESIPFLCVTDQVLFLHFLSSLFTSQGKTHFSYDFETVEFATFCRKDTTNFEVFESRFSNLWSMIFRTFSFGRIRSLSPMSKPDWAVHFIKE